MSRYKKIMEIDVKNDFYLQLKINIKIQSRY